MDATPSSLDADEPSPGALELRAALLQRDRGLDILPIDTCGSTADGLLVTRADSRRMRIWPYGRLWMIRPEICEGGYWYFLADAGRTTADPRQALRAACSGIDPTAGLVVDWLTGSDPRAFPATQG